MSTPPSRNRCSKAQASGSLVVSGPRRDGDFTLDAAAPRAKDDLVDRAATATGDGHHHLRAFARDLFPPAADRRRDLGRAAVPAPRAQPRPLSRSHQRQAPASDRRRARVRSRVRRIGLERGAVGTGFRAPNLSQSYYAHVSTGFRLPGRAGRGRGAHRQPGGLRDRRDPGELAGSPRPGRRAPPRADLGQRERRVRLLPHETAHLNGDLGYDASDRFRIQVGAENLTNRRPPVRPDGYDFLGIFPFYSTSGLHMNGRSLWTRLSVRL
jgi:hypothetical protein